MIAFAILLLGMGGQSAAHSCEMRALVVMDVHEDVPLVTLPAQPFSLHWRNSVTHSMVQADYVVDPHGQIIQIAERFAAHGPGMAHDGTGWRVEGGQMVIDLHRDVGRLILRSAPKHENRLIADDTVIDLTKWPATPLEILSPDCKEPPR